MNIIKLLSIVDYRNFLSSTQEERQYWYRTVKTLLLYTSKSIDVQCGIPENFGVSLGWKVFTDKYGIRVWSKDRKSFLAHEALR